MEYRLSAHAEDELVNRSIPRTLLEATLQSPEQVAEIDEHKIVYQSRIEIEGRVFLLRAIVAHDVDPPLVVTVYRTSKISKYWIQE